MRGLMGCIVRFRDILLGIKSDGYCLKPWIHGTAQILEIKQRKKLDGVVVECLGDLGD